MKTSPLSFVVLALVASSCGATAAGGISEATAFVASECSGGFVVHELDHVTRGPNTKASTLDGTGSGVAVSDLDADGDLDIVLGNLTGEASLFRNDGHGDFERESLLEGRFRHVAAFDLVGDEYPDLVLTTGIGIPVVLENRDGGAMFVRSEGVFEAPAYSMTVADFGGDNDLDVVLAGYNAELTASRSFSAVLAGRSGVWVYEREGDGYTPTRLTDSAQALAVHAVDIDGDDVEDLWVGNDLLTPDAVFLRKGSGWEQTEPFQRTTFSTMSLDSVDLDNDGDEDLFATDMHPMTDDPATLEAWAPIFEDMDAQPRVDDVQHMANALLRRDGDEFAESSAAWGVEASGWSWSGVFGDLDADGFADLYIVNGMQGESLFPDLPDNELVETNQAYRNDGNGAMAPMPSWGLNTTSGGRAVVMADMDGDGDLDVVVNNLGVASAWHENQLCDTGNSLIVDVIGPAGNETSIGAVVTVTTPAGETLTRRIATTRGYLASVPPQVHFGLGDAATVDVEVKWADGRSASFVDVVTGEHVTLEAQP